MKNRITKLLALTATATALSFGATGVWATLVSLGPIVGCISEGGSGTAAYCTANNLFDNYTDAGEDLYQPGPPADPGNGVFIHDYTPAQNGNFVVTAKFTADDTFQLTFLNKTGVAQPVHDGTVMFFAGFEFQGGEENYGLDLANATLKKGVNGPDVTAAAQGFPTVQDVINQMVDVTFGENDTNGNWFKLTFNNDALDFPKGTTAAPYALVLTAKLVHGVPEPGSLALLGAVLVAFGVVQIRRRPRS